jgi:pimeloyl-ACP methyl ester carboxylesterase
LLDSLGVGEAVLVGHSMGGQIAAEFALAHPERVRALALIDASGFGVRVPTVLAVARWPIVGALVAALRGRWLTGRVLKSTYADPSRVTREDVEQYYAPVAEPDFGRAARRALRQYRFDALPGRLGALRVPTLVLWGARDRWIPAATGRRLAAELERAAFIQVPGAGHALPEEAPERVNELLVAFLEAGLPRVPDDLARSRSPWVLAGTLSGR